MGRRPLLGIGKHTLPGLQRQLRPACAFGQLGQQDLGLRRAAVLLQIVDGLAGLGLALVGLDQRQLQRGILGTAAQLVAQAGNQGPVVEQARRQAHHRLPGILAPRVLRNDQPTVQGLLLLPHPFGHLGQAFAPGHVLRRLAHGGRGHAPGIFQVAVFEEYLVAQQVGLVVKGQARRRLARGIGRAQHAPARRGPGHGLQRPGAVVGNRVRTGARSPGHLRLPLLQQRQLQQPLGIALSLGPVAGRARQADELSQRLGVAAQQFFLLARQRQRFVGTVAGLQHLQGLPEVGARLRDVFGRGAGLAQQPGRFLVQGHAQRLPRCGFIDLRLARGIGLALCHVVVDAQGQRCVLEHQRRRGQVQRLLLGQPLQRHVLQRLHHLRRQHLGLSARAVVLLLRLQIALVGGLPVVPGLDGCAGQCLLGRLFPRQLDGLQALFLGLEQGAQVLVAGIALEQVAQVVVGQLGVISGDGEPAFQILLGKQHPQGATDQYRQQRDQPEGNRDGALRAPGIALGVRHCFGYF